MLDHPSLSQNHSPHFSANPLSYVSLPHFTQAYALQLFVESDIMKCLPDA